MTSAVDVVLIEDDPFDAEAAQRALKEHPTVGEVIVISSGSRALDWLQNSENRKVGIVVLDLGLPDMTGVEVLAKMKGDEKLAHLPVVVLSSDSDPKNLLDVYRQGACAFLRKPDSVDGYRNMLDGVMRFWLLASWPPHSHA